MNLKNPILKSVIYYLLTFTLTGIIFIIQLVLGINPLISLPQLSPGIIALIFLVFIEKKSIKDIINEKIVVRSEIEVITILVALFPIIAILCVFFIYINFNNLPFSFENIDLLVLLWPIIGAFCEEFGWRGYFLDEIGKKTRIINASLITGIFWFFWHIQFFFYELIYMLIGFIHIISQSLILTFLYYKSKNSILFCYIFHFIVNVLNYILLVDYLYRTDLFFLLTLLYLILGVFLLIVKRDIFFTKHSKENF